MPGWWGSCRLWVSRKTPLSLCSFSPSGDVPKSPARALASCCFCLHVCQLPAVGHRVSPRTFRVPYVPSATPPPSPRKPTT